MQSARLSNSLKFLSLLDNLCYSCTSLAPPRLAFQLFAGQTIQLLYFCTKNKVVAVVVVAIFCGVLSQSSVFAISMGEYEKRH